MATRAYTVATLAERWECSEGLVRKLEHAGRLQSFRLGTQLRFRPEEVERYECQTTTPSNDSATDGPSSGTTPPEPDIVNDSSQPIVSGQKRRLASVGGSVIESHGRWE